MEEKQKSIKTQQRLLKNYEISLVINDESPTARLKKLTKLNNYGLQLEEISLMLEKRYEQTMVKFNDQIDEVSNQILETLRELKKEVFSSLVFEKHQNVINFTALETKLKERIRETKKFELLPKNTTVEAFKQMFRFSMEFKEEFLNVISSSLTHQNIDHITNDISQCVMQNFSCPLKAPKAFPSELLRFFSNEELQKDNLKVHRHDLGQYLNTNESYPCELTLEKTSNDILLDLKSSRRKSTDSARSFSLLEWLSPGLLLAASNSYFKIVTTSNKQLLKPGAAKAAKATFTQFVDLTNCKTCYESQKLGDQFNIQSVLAVKNGSRVTVLFGGKLSVRFELI